MAAIVVLAVGLVLLVLGVGLLSIPAALIVAGAALGCIALLVDFDTFGRGRK